MAESAFWVFSDRGREANVSMAKKVSFFGFFASCLLAPDDDDDDSPSSGDGAWRFFFRCAFSASRSS